jgi:hypothetical protein
MVAAMGFKGSKDVAAILGIDDSRVRRLARTYQVGTVVGKSWIFTDAEVEILRHRAGAGKRAKGAVPLAQAAREARKSAKTSDSKPASTKAKRAATADTTPSPDQEAHAADPAPDQPGA